MQIVLCMLIVSILTSCYLFPIGLYFLPESWNTKMILAVTGAVLAFIEYARNRLAVVSKYLFGAIVGSFLFSLCCYMSVTLNNTEDYTYVTYFISFFTWLGGAYTVCCFIRWIHGKSNLSLLTGYLAFVCVVQCILAIFIDRVASFRLLVDDFVVQGEDFLHKVDRLYGVGASLDSAGVRFSIVLMLIAWTLCREMNERKSYKEWILLSVAFLTITIVGNMIARTTLVGSSLGIIYILLKTFSTGFILQERYIRMWGVILILLGIGTAVSVNLYETDATFQNQIRFGFEGFFNWVEEGEWRTDSTDKLNRLMWIWPNETNVWIWGTGKFDNWIFGTDIGYCRFILYCGLIGFSVFVMFFVYNAWVMKQRFAGCGLLAFFLLLITFIVWLKVSTDIFFIYALLFCLDEEPIVEEYNENSLLYSRNL